MDLMTAMLASKLAGLNPSGGGGGVTDYNKLENRPCSLEFTGETLFHETVDFTEPVMRQDAVGLIAGETYTLICNNKLYEASAFEQVVEGMSVGVCVNFGTVTIIDIFTEYQEMLGFAAVIETAISGGYAVLDIKVVHGTAVVKPLHPLLLPRIDVTFAKNDEGEYTADKTLDEVMNALHSGYDVKAVLEDDSGNLNYLTLAQRGVADLRFTAVSNITESSDNFSGINVNWRSDRVVVTFNQ